MDLLINKYLGDFLMITGDGAYIKKINRSIILGKIIEHGLISRADLSKITGLNKATISVQVANLLEEELIYETTQEHNVVGRRPIMLSINHNVGYVLGIDFDYRHIQFTIADLSGDPVQYDSVTLETDDYDDIVEILAEHIKLYQKQYANRRYGLVSVTIGIHGTVHNDESINFVPTYQWKDRNLKSALEQMVDIHISIENNANLSAYAERVYIHHESNNLLCLLLSSGIGTGIMIDGKLHKGYHGYAGEMGHMIISPNGRKCRCGNRGCWELYSSEPSFLEDLVKLLKRPQVTFHDVKVLVEENDAATLEFIDQFIVDLSIGLNNIINLYNPETLVLTSELFKIIPNVIEKIEENLHSSVSEYGSLVISKLGNTSCVMGACALGIQKFLAVPELILTMKEDI